MTTALTLPQRAAVALGTAEHEIRLRELALASSSIVAVLNADAREEAHRAAMNLRNARTAITKTGKAAREDATAFSKAVIQEEARLIAIIEPEEERVFTLRDQWDSDREAERQAKISAERGRVRKIELLIDGIRQWVVDAAGKPSAAIQEHIDCLQPPTIEMYQERLEEATQAFHESIAKLNVMKAASITQEAEAARLQAERAELATLRLEAEQRRIEQAAILKAEREQQEKELAAQREEIARLHKLEDDQRAFKVQQERDELERKNTEMRLERARLEKQQNEMAEAQRQRDEQEAERKRLQAAADEMLAHALKPATVPTPGEIVFLVADTYLVTNEVAAAWLVNLDFRPFLAAAPALAA
ncbi:MAG: putative phage coiled coil domain protein [Herminiimonas sp.]|nr:putative phage coiled coil domain protein [Herminiimonas sp.]